MVVEKDLLKCSGCSKTYHLACSSLSNLSGETLTRRIVSWLCNYCESAKMLFASKIDNILSVVEEIKTSVIKHEGLFENMSAKLDELSGKINDLGSRTSSLENRVSIIENKLSSVESQNFNSEESVISEVLERQLRSRNLIVFNVPEHVKNSPTDDTTFVNSLFNSLSINTSTMNITRLGKMSDRPRPLKITLPEATDVFSVLKVKFKLRNFDKFSSIRIFPDRTVMQRNQLREIKSTLEKRKAAGENNLIIKFLKGVPTISKN